MAEIARASNVGSNRISVNIVTDVLNMDHHVHSNNSHKDSSRSTNSFVTLLFVQKLIAEFLGTYFLIFAGCVAMVLDAEKKIVTLPGIALVWGLVVMVMIYSVGHISGAHFNPAVTIALATLGRFPWREVPQYILSQVIGSTLASGTIRLLFSGQNVVFFGTVPSGISDVQTLILEFIITFYFMFVLSAVVTDSRAVGELAGLAIGSVVLVNVIFCGPITGASMNPARSVGPAIVWSHYKGLWIYILGPIAGAVAGAWVHNFIKCTTDCKLKKNC